MGETVLLQDWVTLCGKGDTVAWTYYPHRSSWLWTGRSRGVVLSVEIKSLSGATTPPVLAIETAACEAGPWTTVKEYNAPTQELLYLRREPQATSSQQVAGFIRWALRETAGGGDWEACFRITAVMEGD